MGIEIKFIEGPPPTTRTSGWSDSVMNMLASRPGQWAIVFTDEEFDREVVAGEIEDDKNVEEVIANRLTAKASSLRTYAKRHKLDVDIKVVRPADGIRRIYASFISGDFTVESSEEKGEPVATADLEDA